jgi:apolipoprotein N-acyltransferase
MSFNRWLKLRVKKFIKSEQCLVLLYGHFLGLLVALAFPPTGVWPLVWVTSIFFCRFFLEAKPARRPVDYAIFFASFVFSVQLWGFYWISYTLHEFGNVPWVLAVLGVMTLFLFLSSIAALFGWTWGKLRKRVPAKFTHLALGLLLVVWESVDVRIFPWTFAQSVGSDPILLSSAYYFDTVGWSFLLLFFALAGAWIWEMPDIRKRAAALALLIGAVFGPAYYAGIHAQRFLKNKFHDRQPVALLQGNVGNYEKKLAKTGDYPTVENVISIHRDLIETAAIYFHSEYELKGRVPWIIWPETSFPGSPMTNERHQEILKNFVRLTGGLHVVGTYDHGEVEVGSEKQDVDFNIAALFQEREGLVARYRKRTRVPFGEYVPGDRFYPWIYRKVPSLVHFGAGDHWDLLAHTDPNGPVFIPVVCYEVLFPGLMDAFYAEARNRYPGRELVIVNPTNDSWYGPTSELFTHSLLARWAAVRHGLPLLRSTNTGISQVVAPWGEVMATGPRNVEWLILGELPVTRAFLPKP